MNDGKIKLLILSMLLVGLSVKAFGQKNQDLGKQVLIKISPMALAELETVVFQAGAEYFFNDSLSWQGEIGLNSGVFGAKAGRDQNQNFSFIRFRTEVKWYLNSSYVAAEVFALAKDFDRSTDYFFNGEESIGYTLGNINFFSTGAMAKIGTQRFISKRVSFDKYIGLGFRVNHNEVTPLEGITTGADGPSPILTDQYRYEGWSFSPNFTIGFKIGILTGKR
jgi:hypothetical protein